MGEWEIMSEPLSTIGADDPMTRASCRRDNGLLCKTEWKCFKRLAKCEKKILIMLNQTKLRSFHTTLKCKFRHELPHNNYCRHIVKLDKYNRNILW